MCKDTLIKGANQATSTATSAPAPDSPDDYSYPIHPAANIFPMMSCGRIRRPEKGHRGTRAKGLHCTYWTANTWTDAIDCEACKELHIQPDFCEVEDCDDPIAYVMSHNLIVAT